MWINKANKAVSDGKLEMESCVKPKANTAFLFKDFNDLLVSVFSCTFKFRHQNYLIWLTITPGARSISSIKYYLSLFSDYPSGPNLTLYDVHVLFFSK